MGDSTEFYRHGNATHRIASDGVYHRGMIRLRTGWTKDEVLWHIYSGNIPSIRRRWVKGSDLISYLKRLQRDAANLHH